MGFKFWGAAPGGFFENPAIFDVFGFGFPSFGVRLVRWPLPLGRWPHSGDTVSCVFFSPVKLVVYYYDIWKDTGKLPEKYMKNMPQMGS